MTTILILNIEKTVGVSNNIRTPQIVKELELCFAHYLPLYTRKYKSGLP